jgi:hypothetical protein
VIGKRSAEGSAESSLRIAENSAAVFLRRASSAATEGLDSAPLASSSSSSSPSKRAPKKSPLPCCLKKRWIGPSGSQANARLTSSRMRLLGISSMNFRRSRRASSRVHSAASMS